MAEATAFESDESPCEEFDGNQEDVPHPRWQDRSRLLAFSKHSGLWIAAGAGLRVLDLGDGANQPRVVGSRAVPRAGKEPMSTQVIEVTPGTRARNAIAMLRDRCPLSQTADDAYLVDSPDAPGNNDEGSVALCE